MLDIYWSKKAAIDLGKLGCAAAMLAAPWLFGLISRPAWNLWICGYAILTVALADLTADADWEPRTSLYLAAWLAAAPWALDFAQDTTATFVHIAGGGLVSIMSAVELWKTERNPPRDFDPAPRNDPRWEVS